MPKKATADVNLLNLNGSKITPGLMCIEHENGKYIQFRPGSAYISKSTGALFSEGEHWVFINPTPGVIHISFVSGVDKKNTRQFVFPEQPLEYIIPFGLTGGELWIWRSSGSVGYLYMKKLKA
ncbi:hypothetical protein LCGC14_1011440 [marine sediment metagenome]|uniref:Uncharacterized protein n=1 Tax=marine sediment metagenome TaxID=412755 RepID=A0A0F9N4P3_9ZZZZ